MSIAAYQQMSDPDGGVALTTRTLYSIDLYMTELQDATLDWPTRLEAGIAAITLVQALSENMRDDLPAQEQEILIKVFGQVIKYINKYMRGQHTDLTKELAGLRLIKKLIR